MKINHSLICNDDHIKLCKMMFKILNCNLLWVIYLNNNILVTDQHVLEHYVDKKYYLNDPNINAKIESSKSSWEITFGTDYDGFNKNGFLYDLHKIFHIEEFASVEKNINPEIFCFRFFTKNNRFVFMNKLLNNILLIKYFISTIVKKL